MELKVSFESGSICAVLDRAAFGETGIKQLAIPESVRSIGKLAIPDNCTLTIMNQTGANPELEQWIATGRDKPFCQPEAE
jgi:hypothetical protein